MLKMFTPTVAAGSSPEYWDDNWQSGDMPQQLADPSVCENDPVYRILMEKARPDRLFLEGGCGQGQWVKYLHERGYRALGLDFAPRTVARFHQLVPAAPICVGDIRAMPLADGAVHTYYSGGVVEHDESGPEPSLAEARRVIADDGCFLCSIPETTGLRDRVLFHRDSTERRDLVPPLVVTRVAEMRAEPPPPGMTFFQYAFDRDEFGAQLEAAGFEVVDSFGYGLLWGLMELPRFQSLVDAVLRTRRDARGVSVSADGTEPGTPVSRPRWKQLLVDALVREDRTLPLVGPLVRFATEHLSNMRMYVARPR